MGEGRIDVLATAQWRPGSRLAREAIVGLPAGWRVIDVSGTALTSWDATDPNRIRLRFDGPESADRTVTLRGWVPILTPPAADPTTAHDQPLPWPQWIDARVSPGSLRITSRPGAPVTMMQGDGVIAAENEAGAGAGAVAVAGQSTYSITGDPSGARLRWDEPPGRLQVNVRSLLRLDPAEAELRATLRYRATGAPINQVVFSLPDAWSQAVTVEVPGRVAAVSRESREGATYWTIRPNEPAWCGLSVLVRARDPYPPDRAGVFPELIPRGRGGAVRSALLIANATGRPIVTEGAGVRPVQVRSLGTGLPDLPAGMPVEGYTPVADRWRLAYRLDADPDSGRDDAQRTGIEMASVVVSIGPEGSLWGQSDYDLSPQPGAFLGIALPDGAESLAVMVDGVPGRLLRGQDRTLLIPLNSAQTRRVSFVWKVERPNRDPEGTWRAALPVPLATHSVPTSLTVRTHPGRPTAVPAAGFRPSSPAVAAVRRVEVLSRRLRGELETLDRSSPRFEATLVTDLLRVELEQRQAERVVRGSADRPMVVETRPAAADSARSRAQIDRLHTVRTDLEEAVHLAGLDEWLDCARARAGIPGVVDPRPELVASAIGADGLRIRALGQPSNFWGEALAPGRGLELVGRSTPIVTSPPLTWPAPARWAFLWLTHAISPEWIGPGLLGLALLGAAWWLTRLAPRVPSRLGVGAALLLTVALGAAGSPAALGVLAGLLIGRLQSA
jgi:hypothetical protein